MTRVKAKMQMFSDTGKIVDVGTEGTATEGSAYKRGMCRVKFDNGVEMPVYRCEITLIRKRQAA